MADRPLPPGPGRAPLRDADPAPPPTGCLGVVIPCYNELATIKVVIDRVLASPLVREVVVVDDGSTDGTGDAARGVGDPRVCVLRQPINLGKGAAIRRGFAEVRSPYVIVQDADLEYDPAEYPVVLGPLLDGAADVVYGSRFLGTGARRVLYFWHAVGNKVLTTASNMFTNLNLTDMETCYKAFRLEVVRGLRIEEDRFGVEPEITAKLARQGWRIYEVGISYRGRTYAEGKKIGWRDGLRAMQGIVRYSPAWAAARERIDRAPDRSDPPLEFDDADGELAHVLENLQDADRYADWIYALSAPHLGERVLEIGAGHGEITQRLAVAHRVTATDLSPRCVELLAERFAGQPAVEVRRGDTQSLADGSRYDSVMLVNVLEHIEDDVGALRDVSVLLEPGGRLVVFVPAFEGLYSDFDRRVGHRRRYRRSHLVTKMAAAGLDVVEARYVNTLGAAAWWVFARQLGQVPTQRWSVRLYDRVAVPALRHVEATRPPRFGQSLLCVAERPPA